MNKVVSMNDRSLFDMETDQERKEYCQKNFQMSYAEAMGYINKPYTDEEKKAHLKVLNKL